MKSRIIGTGKKAGIEKGFTLLEIMVVMVILGLLVAIVGPNVIDKLGEGKVGSTKIQLRNIGNALDFYKVDNFSYPSTEQGLESLVSKPSGYPEPKNWNPNGYMPSMPKDPWDNEFQYLSPGLGGPYDLYSFGADGKEGGEGEDADISIWDLDKK